MRTIDQILTPVDGKYGAPLGHSGWGTPADAVGRIYCQYVPFLDGAYDRGGAYWGSPANLYVLYDKGLNYVRFYRLGDLTLRTVYHVYADHTDAFVATRAEANAVYNDLRDEGHIRLRMELQQIITEDGENEESITLLRSRGDFHH